MGKSRKWKCFKSEDFSEGPPVEGCAQAVAETATDFATDPQAAQPASREASTSLLAPCVG